MGSDHERWPDTRLAAYGATCTRPGRDTEIAAALMIAAPDATVTSELVRRAVTEARQNAPGCRDLIVVGFAFEPEVPARVGPCAVHRVVAPKDLRIPELSKNADGRPVAVKAISRTGAEMNAVIHPEAWLPPTDHED